MRSHGFFLALEMFCLDWICLLGGALFSWLLALSQSWHPYVVTLQMRLDEAADARRLLQLVSWRSISVACSHEMFFHKASQVTPLCSPMFNPERRPVPSSHYIRV
jgi:hypothetical protein